MLAKAAFCCSISWKDFGDVDYEMIYFLKASGYAKGKASMGIEYFII